MADERAGVTETVARATAAPRPVPYPGVAHRNYLVLGKPRSTMLVAGSGQRVVTTLPWV